MLGLYASRWIYLVRIEYISSWLCGTVTMLSADVTPQGKTWLFIGFQYLVFVSMAIFAYVVDDIPEEVSHAYTSSCLFADNSVHD